MSVTVVSPTKTAELIEIPFGFWTWLGPMKHALDGDAHWHNLANMIEPSMCGGEYCSLLSNYFNHLLCYVSWSLTSLFSTDMAISEMKGQEWRVILTQ